MVYQCLCLFWLWLDSWYRFYQRTHKSQTAVIYDRQHYSLCRDDDIKLCHVKEQIAENACMHMHCYVRTLIGTPKMIKMIWFPHVQPCSPWTMIRSFLFGIKFLGVSENCWLIGNVHRPLYKVKVMVPVSIVGCMDFKWNCCLVSCRCKIDTY